MSKADSVFVLTPDPTLSVFSSRILSRDSGRRPRRSVLSSLNGSTSAPEMRLNLMIRIHRIK